MFSKTLRNAFGVKHSKYAIIGGGGGGISLAGRLSNDLDFINHEITIYDKSNYHYYKPSWTLVGSGLFEKSNSRYSMKDSIPNGVGWNKINVMRVEPEKNAIHLENGEIHTYDNVRKIMIFQVDYLKWNSI